MLHLLMFTSCLSSISVKVSMHTHFLHAENLVYDVVSEIAGQSRDRCCPPAWSHRSSSFTRRGINIPTSFNFTRVQGPLEPLWLWIYGVWAWMISMDLSLTLTHRLYCINASGQAQLGQIGNSVVLHFHSDTCSFNCYLPSCLFGKLLC